MSDNNKKKFRYAEQNMLTRTNSEAFSVKVEVRMAKMVHQMVFAAHIADEMEYNGKNVRLLAQLKDWRDNYQSKSPFVCEVDDSELHEFMNNFKFRGESLNKGTFAALGNTPKTPDVSDINPIGHEAGDKD